GGLWDWDRFDADGGDSLQGWWPYRRSFTRTDGPPNDVARPWLCNEMGNVGNYATNSPGSRIGYVNPNPARGNGKTNFGVLGYWHVDPGNTVAQDYTPGTGNQIPGTNAKLPGWAPLDLSFLYQTNMSTQTNQTAASRRGWFQFDPKKVGSVVTPGNAGMGGAPNFISNTGIGQPADSFMVYLGVPVDLGAVNLAD